MVILALDYGERRIGVAVSDELEIAAHRRENIERDGSGSEFERIAELVSARDVGMIVVGMPFSMDGSRGSQAHKVSGFVGRLREHFPGVPVKTVDERLTTVQAQRALSMERASLRRRTRHVDGMAAQLILTRYLKRRARERRDEDELHGESER